MAARNEMEVIKRIQQKYERQQEVTEEKDEPPNALLG
jgi:hypothetical protein